MLLKKRIPIWYLFGIVRKEILFISIYTIAIAVLYVEFDLKRFEVPISVPMILGTVLSLLLGFRSNQAYDRWWESRIVWGAIVNDSRSFTREWLTYTAGVKDPEIKSFIYQVVNRHCAWLHSLGQALRGQNPLSGIDRLLTKEDFEEVSKFKNVHNALLHLQGRSLAFAYEKGWLNAYQQVSIDDTLSKFSDEMGKCERIKNTVFPTTYSYYLHLSLNFFLLLLPLSLITIFGLYEIPIVIIVGVLFLLIEKMAIQLQDPFENKPTDTAVTSIAYTIERDINQMIAENAALTHPIPDAKPLPKMGKYIFYQM